MTDLRDAQRSYEANLNVIAATRRMIQRTLDILKGSVTMADTEPLPPTPMPPSRS